jgi:1,4-alpha-glucan branching enzyme
MEMTGFGEQDTYLFREGTHRRLHELLGAHLVDGGCRFAVWAPNAVSVSVMGEFNGWQTERAPLELDGATGVWSGVVEGVTRGHLYKFHVRSAVNDYRVDKSDPFAIYREVPPETASIVWDLDYSWHDAGWMSGRANANGLDAPWSIYEVHLGSWRRSPDGAEPTYRQLAPQIADYVRELGFTHVELLPIMEHPYYPSWGYQTTGYFAPTSRYGTPQDFMYFVDILHQAGIGVILDWVPSHFPSDAHGLGYFDGTYLFEHADPRKRIHPDWDSLEFNYARGEVQSFLTSSAAFWLERYHVDALRVDAVASMLYLDYSRDRGEWEPNRFGGRENLEAMEFLRRLNEMAYGSFPGTQIIAEESTAWPLVSHPTYLGGLGFGMKWDLGFMHDSLDYMSEEPHHRRFHQEKLTFRPMYAFSENFVVPLSHDEVVHGKGSLLTKMPGRDWAQFANLRVLYGYMWAQPGKKLLFMGGEFGQRTEWNHDEALEWFVLEHPQHRGTQRWVQDLNAFYRAHGSLHETDFKSTGFEWIDCENHGKSVLSFVRMNVEGADPVVAVYNFSSETNHDYRVGVPRGGRWDERLNSDSDYYGGRGGGNLGGVDAEAVRSNGRESSIVLSLPALSAIFLTPASEARKRKRARRK